MRHDGFGRFFAHRCALFVAAILTCWPATATTKTVNLDGNSANGNESQCDLNVLQTFPVKIENKITNRAVGAAFSFAWNSAGPAGFKSSVVAGTTAGKGIKWTWTTNQPVYSFTGSTCAKDVCFTQTGTNPVVTRGPLDRKSTRLNSSHSRASRMPSSA